MALSGTQSNRRHSAGAFLSSARARGVRSKVARALKSAALALFPENPQVVLSSRVAFEQAATHAVIGDAGNLELSFGLVDALAGAVETLGLARASDVPDPFRRVWVINRDGARKRGVVLRCAEGEVAVFCPPSQDPFTGAGHVMKLSYRGFASSVEYELHLNDAVRLPGALVLHLTRPGGGGAIGRDNRRIQVDLRGSVRALGNSAGPEWTEWTACHILDVSAGGMRIASDLPLGPGQELEVQLSLPDDDEQPIEPKAIVCWNRADQDGNRCQGLQLVDWPAAMGARWETFLQRLTSEIEEVSGEDPEPTAHDLEPRDGELQRRLAELDTLEAQLAQCLSLLQDEAALRLRDLGQLRSEFEQWCAFEADRSNQISALRERLSAPDALGLSESDRADLQSRLNEETTALRRAVEKRVAHLLSVRHELGEACGPQSKRSQEIQCLLARRRELEDEIESLRAPQGESAPVEAQES